MKFGLTVEKRLSATVATRLARSQFRKSGNFMFSSCFKLYQIYVQSILLIEICDEVDPFAHFREWEMGNIVKGEVLPGIYPIFIVFNESPQSYESNKKIASKSINF